MNHEGSMIFAVPQRWVRQCAFALQRPTFRFDTNGKSNENTHDLGGWGPFGVN